MREIGDSLKGRFLFFFVLFSSVYHVICVSIGLELRFFSGGRLFTTAMSIVCECMTIR